MTRLALLILGLIGLAACGATRADQVRANDRPMRIVSLDYCADQYVLKLADRDQVLALSPDAAKNFSYMREAAKGLPTVRATAENVLVLKPDLIVRSYGGGPNAQAFFERAGIPVLNVGWTSSIDGAGMTSIPGVIQHMADGLGQGKRGEALVADFKARLAVIEPQGEGRSALYMTTGGVTTGPGSLVHQMLQAAGYENFQQAHGWHPIPLERLAHEQPDIVAPALFGNGLNTPDAWSPAKHPIARAQLEQRPVVMLEGAWTACGAWFLIDAIEALSEGGAR